MSGRAQGGLLGALTAADGPPLLSVAAVYRRAVIASAAVVAVVFVVSLVLGAVLFAIGSVLGVGAGALNNRASQARALRMIEGGGKVKKKPFATSVLARLGIITGVAFYLMYALPQAGWGMLAGVALFQALLLGTTIGSLLRRARSAW